MGWLPFCDHMKDHAAEVEQGSTVLYGRHAVMDMRNLRDDGFASCAFTCIVYD